MVQSYHIKFYKILTFTSETLLKQMSIAFKVPNITETATLFFTSMGTSSGETEEH